MFGGKNFTEKRMNASKLLTGVLPEVRDASLCTSAGGTFHRSGSFNPQFATSKHVSAQWLSFG
jgi:hypothetical protein